MKTIKYYIHKYIKKNSEEVISGIRTKSILESFMFLSEKVKKHERLFFVRFGDGEFVTMMKQNHRNYVYNENLEKEIEASFRIKNEEYLISCPINYPYDEFHAKGIYKNFSWQQEMIDVMEDKELPKDTVFENPCIFQCLAVFKPKLLKVFLDENIRGKTKMFIGSTDKETAEKLYGDIKYYVNIPVKNAYETIDDWWPAIKKNASNVDLIIPSAGSTSNVIALRLWNMNISCKVIDFGSIVDAVEYKVSRTWIRLQGHKVRKLLVDKDKINMSKKILFLAKDVKFYFRNQII